ncbi:MAG TPA: alpha/beta hydrolase-fold protein [Terriglobales bacterium]|nr:alpha/beta hydrolase-fold protein [Terriglobales bacterium]
MKAGRRLCLGLVVLLSLPLWAAEPLRFRVTLAPELGTGTVSGRLLVFLQAGTAAKRPLAPDFLEPQKVWMEAIEVHDLVPGRPLEVAPTLAFPKPFAEAAPGDYQLMAVLDTRHTFAYSGLGEGGLRSEVITMKSFNPAAAAPVEFSLSVRVPGETVGESETLKLVEMESPRLSRFWGRPVTMKAAVLLPPSYAASPGRKYPTVYVVHGFEGTHISGALYQAPRLAQEMAAHQRPEMIYVFLDGQCPLGHHEFADSVNNGPWGESLVREFIPYLEKQFHMDGVARGRLLTGHSSGGWSTLWLETHYPAVFGGTWSTSPDPPDFRSLTDVDLLAGENLYRKADGTPRNLVRYHGRQIMSIEEYVRLEEVEGDYGGQFESFNAVFSPRGDDGRPMPMFDTTTGAPYPEVVKEWEENYDIDAYLKRNWVRLRPELRGKLHLWVGAEDNFHLEDGVRLLEQTLEQLGGAEARVTYVPGRDHFDLYRGGLSQEIARQMYAVARPEKKKD